MNEPRTSGYTLVGLAMMMLVAGVVVLTILPPVIGKLKTQALQKEKAGVLGLRDTVLGFAMDTCRLPTLEELQAVAPQYGLTVRTGYILPATPVLTTPSALAAVGAATETDLALLVPVQAGDERRENLAFLIYGTGLNRCRDLEAVGTEYRARVPGECFELDGNAHVYDDLVRGVTLQALCSKTGCCR